MTHLPDTNARAFFFLGEPGLANRWSDNVGDIHRSVLVRTELRFGAAEISPVRQEKHLAAQALRLGATVVAHKLREFRRVPGLRAEDWQTTA